MCVSVCVSCARAHPKSLEQVFSEQGLQGDGKKEGKKERGRKGGMKRRRTED